jgi:hypothetical protein
MQASAFYTLLAPRDRTFTAAAFEAATELGEEAMTGDLVARLAKREGSRLLSEGIQAAPDYLKSLLSWQDQLKRGKLTVHLDTTSLDKQTSELRSIVSMLVVAVLVAGALVGSAIASQVFAQAADGRLATLSEVGYFASLGVAAVLVVLFLWRLTHSRRR